MRTFAIITTIGCLAIAAWLAWALTVVVPVAERDANLIWVPIALMAVASAALTGWLLWSESSARSLRLAVVGGAIVALAIGGWLLAVTVVATGQVEEYVPLIGAWLIVHGITSLVLARRARRPRVVSAT